MEFNSSRNICKEGRNIILVEDYKQYIKDISNETGFIQSTLEKVERLIRILEWINNHNTLSDMLVLKGGTAINLTIFDLPRLSVDIDLDYTNNNSRDDMLKDRKKIKSLLIDYLEKNGYQLSKDTREHHALESI